MGGDFHHLECVWFVFTAMRTDLPHGCRLFGQSMTDKGASDHRSRSSRSKKIGLAIIKRKLFSLLLNHVNWESISRFTETKWVI